MSIMSCYNFWVMMVINNTVAQLMLVSEDLMQGSDRPEANSSDYLGWDCLNEFIISTSNLKKS